MRARALIYRDRDIVFVKVKEMGKIGEWSLISLMAYPSKVAVTVAVPNFLVVMRKQEYVSVIILSRTLSKTNDSC